MNSRFPVAMAGLKPALGSGDMTESLLLIVVASVPKQRELDDGLNCKTLISHWQDQGKEKPVRPPGRYGRSLDPGDWQPATQGYYSERVALRAKPPC
jgi:hypothetical protein